MGESQSNGIIERAVELVAGQARTLKAALEHRIGTRVPPDARILCWLVAFAALLMNRCESTTKVTAAGGCMGERTTHRHWNSERRFCTCQPSQQEEESGHPGVFLSMLNSSSEAVVVTEQGLAIKTRSANVRRIPESERWDADRILGMRAVPWSPDGSDNAFDIQVGHGEARGDGASPPWRGADGKQSSEDLPFAEQTSNNGVSVKVVLDADT